MPQLHELRPAQRPKARKRVGRGHGSGHGKTSGRGQKGQGARSGGVKGPGFEGGQMPLQRRLPARGFNNPLARKWTIVNLDRLNRFDAGTVVTPELLLQSGIIKKKNDGIKVLGNGELEVALTIQAHQFSEGARQKIEAAGGKAEVI